MGGAVSTLDDSSIPGVQAEWRELMDDLIYMDNDSIVDDDDDENDDTRSAFFTQSCNINQAPTWLFERQEYERDLVRWHKKKVKSLRKHVKSPQMEFTLQQQQQTSWLLTTFNRMTCYGCGVLKNEANNPRWRHPPSTTASNKPNPQHNFRRLFEEQKPRPPPSYMACMSHMKPRQ